MSTPKAPNAGALLRPLGAPSLVETQSLQQVENLLASLEDRWARYWAEMWSLLNTRIPDDRRGGRCAKRKRIRSAVYGDIDLQYPDLMYLIDMPYVQRLRQISQMGLVHFVYPEARHSRFDHTLGVAWNVQKICTSLGKLTPKEKKTLLAAAILHDIGHGPFSHCAEMLEESLSDNCHGVWGLSPGGIEGMPAYHQFPEAEIAIGSKTRPHEVNGVRLIYDHPIALALVRRGLRRIGTTKQQDDFNKNSSLGIGVLLDLLGVSPRDVSRMIVGDRANGGPLVDVINGDLDADKFDYYQRDAYFTGAGQAGADVEYIVHNMRLITLPRVMGGQKAFSWPVKAVNDLVFNLMSRKYFYVNTANHPVAQNANAMLATAFFESYRALQDACLNLDRSDLCRNTAGKLLAYLPFMEDQDVWAFLDIMARLKSDDKYRQDCCEVTGHIVSRLRARSLFNRSSPQAGTTGNEFTQRIYASLRKDYFRRDADKNELVDFVYLIDHTDAAYQCGERQQDAFKGITLVDWGWSPDNQKTLGEFVDRKKRLFGGDETPGSRPTICIMRSNYARKPASLSTALGDSDKKIATGIATYEYSMSFVQVLNDNRDSDASGQRKKITDRQLLGLPAQIGRAYKDLMTSQRSVLTRTPSGKGRNLHGADRHRIGPNPAKPGVVPRAIKSILPPN